MIQRRVCVQLLLAAKTALAMASALSAQGAGSGGETTLEGRFRRLDRNADGEVTAEEGKNAVKWTRLSCHDFADNQVRLQLFALAYNLGKSLRRLALPNGLKHWSLTTLREKLIRIGVKVVTQVGYVVFQMAEVAVPRWLLATILERIRRLVAFRPRAPVPSWGPPLATVCLTLFALGISLRRWRVWPGKPASTRPGMPPKHHLPAVRALPGQEVVRSLPGVSGGDSIMRVRSAGGVARQGHPGNPGGLDG